VVHQHDSGPLGQETCRLDEALRMGASIVVDDDVFRRKDGSTFAVQYRSSPLLRDGQVDGAVVAFEDITERKAAAERLRQLTLILEESTDFIAMARADSTGFTSIRPDAGSSAGIPRKTPNRCASRIWSRPSRCPTRGASLARPWRRGRRPAK